MTLRVWLLSLVLALSLGLNLYLFTRLGHNQLVEPTEVQQQISVGQPGSRDVTAIAHDELKPAAPEFAVSRRGGNPSPKDMGLLTPQLRETWLHQNRTWLGDGQYQRVAHFLREYLKQYPRDLEFLILEGDLVAKTGLLSDAILHYYALLDLPLSEAQHTRVKGTIQALTKNTITQLKKAYSWNILAVFVEPLLQIAPTNREFILALSQAYAEQQQVSLMENILAALDYYDPDAMAIRNIIQVEQIANQDTLSIDDSIDDDVAIGVDLSQHGDQYVVSVQLSGNSLNLLIDTGASTTAISRQVFSQLSNKYKINFIGRFLVNTANGEVLAPMYQFASLQINHAIVENISVVVLPMAQMEHADGLLGMNFLREFEFRLDQKNARLYLN